MVTDWSWWVLLAAWAISFGLSVHWARKYFKLKKIYDEQKYIAHICLFGSYRRYRDDESYVGNKTSILSDLAFDKASALLREKQEELLITNYPINESQEDKGEK